jgi:hypothetical protein
MAFGGEVYDRPRFVLIEEFLKGTAVGDIALDESVPVIVRHTVEIVEIAGVSQLIEIQDGRRPFPHFLQDKVRSDKSCATSDENSILHARRTSEAGGTAQSRTTCRL